MANNIFVVNAKFDGAALPQDIVADANVLIDFVDKGSKVNGEAESLIYECLRCNKNIYTTPTVMLEAQQWIDNAGINEEALALGINLNLEIYKGGRGRKLLQKDISKKDPMYYKRVCSNTNNLMQSISKVVEVLDNVPEATVHTEISKIQALFSWEIGAMDASIIATANAYGINTFATSDFGFSKGDNINIIALPKGPFISTSSATAFLDWKNLS